MLKHVQQNNALFIFPLTFNVSVHVAGIIPR